MKRYSIFFFLLFLSSNPSFAQNRASIWELGYNQGGGCFEYRFSNQGLSVVPVVRKMNLGETNASICDRYGNLLMYTNGAWIANAQHDTMMNGGGINPGLFNQIEQADEWGMPSIQTALFLPDPADSMQYYLIHMVSDVNQHLEALELMYTKIDMRLDNGSGAVIAKNQIIFSDSLVPAGLTAVKHANGRDWWIISHQQMTDAFHILLLTPDGFTDHIQHIGNTPDLGGQAAFSSEGNTYAAFDTYVQNNLDVLRFDRCSGLFSNYTHVQINDTITSTGVAFSPDSRMLYVCSGTHVYQFDVTAANIASTLDTVATYDGFYSPQPPFATTFFIEQLAPDGKIYIASTNSVEDMHVINDPNNQGSACNLIQHSVHMPSYNSIGCLPNLINYDLGPVVGSICDTINVIAKEISGPKLDVTYDYSQEQFYVHAERLNLTETKIELSDISGKILWMNTIRTSADSLTEFIPAGQLASGTYLIAIILEGGRLVKKIVKF